MKSVEPERFKDFSKADKVKVLWAAGTGIPLIILALVAIVVSHRDSHAEVKPLPKRAEVKPLPGRLDAGVIPEVPNDGGSTYYDLDKRRVIHVGPGGAYQDRNMRLSGAPKPLPSRSGAIQGGRSSNFVAILLARQEYIAGLHLSSIGKMKEATPHYQRALQIKPNFYEAHNNLAISLYAQGYLSAALDEWQRAIPLKPKDPMVFHNLLAALTNNGIAILPVDRYIPPRTPVEISDETTSFFVFNQTDKPIYGMKFEAYTFDASGKRIDDSVHYETAPVEQAGASLLFVTALGSFRHVSPMKATNLHIDITFFRQTMGLKQKASFLYLPENSPRGYWRWVPTK